MVQSTWELTEKIKCPTRSHPITPQFPQTTSLINFCVFYFILFCFLGHREVPQAKGWIPDLCHSKAVSELYLWPTPHVTATTDPYPIGWGQGWTLVKFVIIEPQWELPVHHFKWDTLLILVCMYVKLSKSLQLEITLKSYTSNGESLGTLYIEILQ